MTTTRSLPLAAVFLALVLLGACAQEQAEPAAASEPAAEPVPTSLPRTPSPEGASVFFIIPADGDTVPNPIRVEFGVAGMSIVAAGMNEAHSGHHHLLIDTDPPDMGLPIPADAHHVHFGDASTSTELTLAPGTHTLRLLLGDHLHIPHNPPIMSEPISITVE
jgi:hypothetical protein